MSQPPQPQSQDKTNPKGTHQVTSATNRWTNISSDQDQSQSEQSEKQQPQQITTTIAENKQPATEPLKEEPKKKEPNIVPFDPKKKFRGDRSNVKVIKGGFKAEKLQQKKFQLNTIRNPFEVDDDSEEQKQDVAEPTTQNTTASQVPQSVKPVEATEEPQVKSKKTKKSKKQQERQQLEQLMKELGVQNKAEGVQEGQGKKKKKKNKPKKAEGEVEQEVKQQPQPVEAQPQKVEQYAVNRQQIQQVMRKKAAEASKPASKKGGKGALALNAKKAIEERQAKNKSKKVYVDL